MEDLMQIVIRPATLDDTTAVAKLAGELGYPASTTEMADRLTSLSHQSAHAVFVAELNSNVVAWIHICVVESLESAPFAEIRGMVVTETHRGSGIGTKLVIRVERWAAEKACSKIRVRSNSARTQTQQFYEKLNYEVKKNQNVLDKQLP